MILTYLFEDCELCDMYKDNLQGLVEHNKILKNLLSLKIPELYDHLIVKYEIRLDIMTVWIIDLFSHVIPLNHYVSSIF